MTGCCDCKKEEGRYIPEHLKKQAAEYAKELRTTVVTTIAVKLAFDIYSMPKDTCR